MAKTSGTAAEFSLVSSAGFAEALTMVLRVSWAPSRAVAINARMGVLRASRMVMEVGYLKTDALNCEQWTAIIVKQSGKMRQLDPCGFDFAREETMMGVDWGAANVRTACQESTKSSFRDEIGRA